MVTASNLMRSNSEENSLTIEANTNNIPKGEDNEKYFTNLRTCINVSTHFRFN